MKILITGGNGNISKIIYNNLSDKHNIKNPTKDELNLLDLSKLNVYLEQNDFDILIHAAITGGRRTKPDDSSVVYYNVLMWENILMNANKFKLIINLDSAAIYDRSSDIMSRSEEDITRVPTDYYGLSKYIIHKRSFDYKHIYNFRIFNIFHKNEEPDRFIKKCITAKETNTSLTIFEDKYFDFFSEEDFITVLNHYIDHFKSDLPKTINICYDVKYKLSDIAKIVLGNGSKIIVLNDGCLRNYCGDNKELKKLNLSFKGIIYGLLNTY